MYNKSSSSWFFFSVNMDSVRLMSLRSFLTALSFLTVLGPAPAPRPTLKETGESSWAFPIVGALLGAALLTGHAALLRLFPAPVAAILIVALWIGLTGALHLDGWADCCDALMVAAPPEKRRLILKDSRLGSFGAVGLLMLVLLKITAIASAGTPALALFTAPVTGRAALVWLGHGARTGHTGMAHDFASGIQPSLVKLVVLSAFLVALVMGTKGLVAALLGFAAGFCFLHVAQSRLGIVNGDVLGAACELCEAVVVVLGAMR